MAKQELPVDFKDDVLQAEMAGKRKYRIIQNEDGTISLEDVTNYSQIGSNFGAAQMNATNLAVNESFDKNKVIDSLADIVANEATGYAAGALAVRELNGNSCEISEIPKTDITWTVKKYKNGYFEAFGTYSGYVSRSDTYQINVLLPFTVKSVIGAMVNPSYHAFYLSKWYINEPQTYSKSALSLAFVTKNVSSQTDFKFDIYCEGTY